MKAIVYTKYGPPEVLHMKEVEKPVPRDNEVLVRIDASTVTTGDCEIRSSTFPAWLWLPMRLYLGLIRPRKKILGQELSGEIKAVGSDVKLFKKGDQVFGTTGIRFGAYAEYICLPEESNNRVLGLKPANMTYEEAAAAPFGGLDALHFIRNAGIRKGQKVLISGAGGSIGTFAVQLAKYFGAEVTCVDSAEKLDMLLSIGADKTIDYAKEDFTKNGEIYDIILDVIGKSPFSDSLGSIKENGYYLLTNPRPMHMIRGAWTSGRGSKKVIFEASTPKKENIIFLKELIEAGKIKSVI